MEITVIDPSKGQLFRYDFRPFVCLEAISVSQHARYQHSGSQPVLMLSITSVLFLQLKYIDLLSALTLYPPYVMQSHLHLAFKVSQSEVLVAVS